MLVTTCLGVCDAHLLFALLCLIVGCDGNEPNLSEQSSTSLTAGASTPSTSGTFSGGDDAPSTSIDAESENPNETPVPLDPNNESETVAANASTPRGGVARTETEEIGESDGGNFESEGGTSLGGMSAFAGGSSAASGGGVETVGDMRGDGGGIMPPLAGIIPPAGGVMDRENPEAPANGQMANSCGAPDQNLIPVDCTIGGDADARCIMNEHCLCSPGFRCLSNRLRPGTQACDPGSICIPEGPEGSRPDSCGSPDQGLVPVDCTVNGDFNAQCVFSNHCFCSMGFKCEDAIDPGGIFPECKEGSVCEPE